MAFGWAGVDLFFVLSGFLITGILFDTQRDPGYFRKFYARRSLRIFAIYYLFLFVTAKVGILVGVRWTAGHISFLLYAGFPASLVWPSLIPASSYIRVTHLWSLCMEEQFYLIWPALIAALATPRRILRRCVVLMCVALALRVLVWRAGWLTPSWAYTFLPFRMDSLALGAALAILIRGSHAERLAKAAPTVLACSSAGLLAVLIASRTTEHDAPLIGTIGFTLIALVSGSLLLLGVLNRGIVRNIFSTQALRTVGKYSYGLYLYHFPLAVLLDPCEAPARPRSPLRNFRQSHIRSRRLGHQPSRSLGQFPAHRIPIMNLKNRFRYG